MMKAAGLLSGRKREKMVDHHASWDRTKSGSPLLAQEDFFLADIYLKLESMPVADRMQVVSSPNMRNAIEKRWQELKS